MKKAILLINLGTPDDCDPASVRRYLREFLNDARVVDLPAIWRWLLVNVLIVPFRYKKSAAAYQKIWQRGSPLLNYSKEMCAALAERLGPDYHVELGMRYGQPSIASAIAKLQPFSAIKIIPLFPQYSSAATGSAVEKSLAEIATQWNVPSIEVVHDFYNHPSFIKAYAAVILERLQVNPVDKILFSYHGLPERHIQKSHCRGVCDHEHACPLVSDANRYCYRAQCYETTRLIAEELSLTPDQYTVAFQSRLGRTPWIKPYTDLVLPELARQGVKKIAVVSPSFVADCLETLEEIDIRTREHWMSLGGEGFEFVPCLNGHEKWIECLREISEFPLPERFLREERVG